MPHRLGDVINYEPSRARGWEGARYTMMENNRPTREMRVIIVGAGSVGCELASRVSTRHQVLLLDHRLDCLPEKGSPREPDEALSELGTLPGTVCVRGDGTSRLVLSKLFVDDWPCALVAVTGSDETNIEAGRLAVELGFVPVVGLSHDISHLEAYREARITPLDRSKLLVDEVERALHFQGAVVPTNIGLGAGELVEIRLQRSSPILHTPLRQLSLQQWRVAAIFRGKELIVPTGTSTLEVDDRVLLVGDPKILATVTEYLRRGTPQFPQPFGPNVAVLEYEDTNGRLLEEARKLACNCNVAHLARGIPGASVDETPAEENEEPLTCAIGGCEITVTTFDLPEPGNPQLAARLARQRPGAVFVAPVRNSRMASILGVQRSDSRICDATRAPIVFARDSSPYQRILLPVSASTVNLQGAEMAIDLARRLGAALTAVNVDLPRYVSGLSEADIHGEVVPIRRLAELYEVPLEYRHHRGNPVKCVLSEAESADLVVVVRRYRRRDSFFDPDVALRIAREAACSVAVLTVGHPE